MMESVQKERPMEWADHKILDKDEISNQPLVTVVMPTYHHVPFIQTAFDGILGQSYKQIEVIVVSYKRDKETTAWLYKYLPKGWTWIQSSVLYAIHQLNMGFEEANGEYIVFASTDDLFHPFKIETDVKTVEANNAWVSYGPFQHGDEHRNVKDVYDPPHELKYEMLLQRDIIPDCSLFSRDALWHADGFWDEALGESGGPIWDFWLKILEKDPKLFAYNPYVGWIYRQGQQQTSARRPPADVTIRKWMIERSLRRKGRL